MTDFTISRRELRLAETVARQLINAFIRRKLIPAFSDFLVTHLAGVTMLIAVIDTAKLGDHSPYTNPDLLHQLSTDLGGMSVRLSNHSGIRLVILLSPLPKLPHKVNFPVDAPRGRLAIGESYTGQPVLLDWAQTTHLAVLGNTGSGKSIFLQSLVAQAIRDDMQLLLSDIDQTTFGMLENHPNLAAPIATRPQWALGLIEQALAECDRRAELFKNLPERPQKLSEYNALAVKAHMDPQPRMLVVLDEASTVITALGGAKGAMGQALATLGWRGRKFGVHFIFAAQEFTKDIVGPVRDQVGLTLCFRVRNGQMAERMGCKGAERIPENRPGLAISDRHGPIQTYFVDHSHLGQPQNLFSAMSDLEHSLFTLALSEGGKLPASKVQEWGRISEWQARRMLETWALKGWLAKDSIRDNAFCITPKMQVLLSNHQTAQTGSNRPQTGTKPSQTD
ncbi:MAG: FtsK/SpoIIIE domain-containing protein [Chloroflexi bacterium]|nr:FtsK/SpoIIIE domain-containing protein [Chloroflexota bacterium]